MQYPEIKNYPDSSDELNLVDYERFQRVKDLFQLIHDYDAFPFTPIIPVNGQVDMSKRYKQGNIKADWTVSWDDIVQLIGETRDTIVEVIGYYRKAVRNGELIPGADDEYPGPPPPRAGDDPYDKTVKDAFVFFLEFYPRYKTLEKWVNLGMDHLIAQKGPEIKEQMKARAIQKLVTKKVTDMTGDDIIQLLELYDELKTQPQK